MAHQTFLTQSAGPQNRYRDCLGISIRAGIFRIDITPLARSLIKGPIHALRPNWSRAYGTELAVAGNGARCGTKGRR
jgi:hypothetical protein